MPYKDPERQRAYVIQWRKENPLRMLLHERTRRRKELAARRARIEQELKHG